MPRYLIVSTQGHPATHRIASAESSRGDADRQRQRQQQEQQ